MEERKNFSVYLYSVASLDGDSPRGKRSRARKLSSRVLMRIKLGRGAVKERGV